MLVLLPLLALVAPPYRELYFDQRLDHFRFDSTAPTWKQRYLVDDSQWVPGRGPILFYSGNEGPITAFWEASGFVTTTLAKKLGALVLFAEQRYYGTSLPFGDASTTVPAHLAYLSTEQVLADYAHLLTTLKPSLTNGTDVPVVTFGGSYGGTLSTLFRAKYPHVVVGALAARAHCDADSALRRVYVVRHDHPRLHGGRTGMLRHARCRGEARQ